MALPVNYACLHIKQLHATEMQLALTSRSQQRQQTPTQYGKNNVSCLSLNSSSHTGL